MTVGDIGAAVMPLVEWKKPMILANYVLGECAPWLTNTTELLAANRPVVCVSTERDEDLVAVARGFSLAKGLSAGQSPWATTTPSAVAAVNWWVPSMGTSRN